MKHPGLESVTNLQLMKYDFWLILMEFFLLKGI